MLQEGTFARASIVGFIEHGDLVVLSVGGRHVETQVECIIDGAPKALWRSIIEALAGIDAKVYIRQIGTRIYAGFEEVSSSRFSVRSFAYILPKTSEVSDGVGLICIGTRSHRLYWLPANEVGRGIAFG